MHLIFRIGLFSTLFALSTSLSAQYSYPRTGVTTIQPFLQLEMDVSLSLTLENASTKTYALSWEVLESSLRKLGSQEELHCFVRDNSGLVGHYQGMSSPMTFCYFQTADKAVDVFFCVRTKQFPIDSSPNRSNIVNIQRMDYIGFQCDRSEYAAVKLSLKHNHTTAVSLKNNTRILYLSHRNAHAMYPDEMPRMGCFYDMCLCLDRYYINRRTGRILPGRRWMARKSVEGLINRSRLEMIDPDATYRFKDGVELTGAEVIKKRKASMLYFAVSQPSPTRGIAPY